MITFLLSVILLAFSYAIHIPSPNAATLQGTSSPTRPKFAARETNSTKPSGPGNLEVAMILLFPALFTLALCIGSVVVCCRNACRARAPATAVAQAQAMQMAVANVSPQMPTITMGNPPRGILNVPNPDQPALISESGRPSLDITVVSDSESVRST
ncbi:hypothetical protein K443DRAFT_135346 [Laccaria amethystina LaAM-08-1]|uniref:Uncharacterized protein n=1 Tax=Laccaria amethystina LaAM-08-1 TaxID=1095629 RepID=A0A0C9WUI1_9AGAR|nr:hypothetical protein K443DRAFT_135346 [Laccaria amethystina LaAM-08-1]